VIIHCRTDLQVLIKWCPCTANMRERLLLQFAQAAPAYANRLVAKF
jgi:hypothetical protein